VGKPIQEVSRKERKEMIYKVYDIAEKIRKESQGRIRELGTDMAKRFYELMEEQGISVLETTDDTYKKVSRYSREFLVIDALIRQNLRTETELCFAEARIKEEIARRKKEKEEEIG